MITREDTIRLAARHEADLMEFRLRQVRKILMEHSDFAKRLSTDDQKILFLMRGIDAALKEIGQ